MASSTTPNDPRPLLEASLDQYEALVDVLNDTDLSQSTPCGQYDVQAVLAHVIAVLRKLITVGRGGDMTTVTDPADDVVGLSLRELRQTRADLRSTWALPDLLERECTVAWGTMTGRELLDAYTHEFTVHAWDLASTTGRVADLDPQLSEAALDWFTANVPADQRSDDGPFGPVVAVDETCDIHTRLAGFVGRQV
ncbi:MAG: TIGR03086 family metal-binding protein [Propionibacteriales bacterium]|nr:TIGR03086 family metal-binding protein [Propionibacteriales bacterium]